MNNKDTKQFINKNHFILAFGITFAIFMVALGVHAAINPKTDKTAKEVLITTEAPTETVVEEVTTKTEDNTKDAETDVGEITTKAEEATDETTAGSVKNASFTTAPASYLNGALFIGDSRTDTLASYAGWKKTTFFVETGLTIWDVMDKSIAKVGGNTMTVKAALKSKQYEKIYFMLGVNELGTGTAETFYQQYKKVIKEIVSYQPNAVIYIQSIMHVTQGKDDEGYYINNKNIDARNAKIKKIADNVHTFWIDENEIFDKAGTSKLDSKYTSDGVHLKPQYIPKWKKFFLSHVIQK